MCLNHSFQNNDAINYPVLMSCSIPLMAICVFQVLSAATIVAKHTSALCNACRIASSKTANPVAKRHFVQSAKEVANSTANLVKTIKVHDSISCTFIFLNLIFFNIIVMKVP